MRKELRRSLFVAAVAGAALAGCGGGGGYSGAAPGSAPPPPPSGPPTTAGNYFLLGQAGGTSTAGASIPFADLVATTGGATPSSFGLTFVDPTSLPAPFSVDTGQFQLEVGGTALPLASVSEYFPSGANATNWGTRYVVYAKASSNSAGVIYAVDLRKAGTTPPPNPVPVQLSSGTVTSLHLCSTPPVVFDNYRSADQSWIVFHALGGDNNCGTTDDRFVALQLSMTAGSTAVSLVQGMGAAQSDVEPVEALYDGNGTITGFLAIDHPPVCPTPTSPPTCAVGSPSSPPPLQQLGATFGSPKQLTTLNGNALNLPGGDFLSLGISAGNIWLYLDSAGIYAVNLASGAVSSAIVTLATGDAVGGRAVFDGTKAYVAIDNSAGSEIVQIDLANNYAVASVARDPTLSAIRLVGVTTGAVVYFGTNSSTATNPGVINLRSAVKSTLTANPVPLNTALSTTQSIDSLMGPNGASGAPVAFLVGDTVYFTVADTAASGATGFAKQAFYVKISGSGVPAATMAVAATVSAVLGVVAPSPTAISGASANTGALVLTGGSNAASGSTNHGGAAFAAGGTTATQASLGLYSAAGTVTTTLGSLNSLSLGTGVALTNPIYSAAFDNGPVQAGMPAMLELTGSAGGNPAEDIAVYTPSTASSLTQVSGFSQ